MNKLAKLNTAFLAPALLALSSAATADVAGITGPQFSLTARAGHIVLGDANNMLTWGFGDDNGGTGQMQYPGPTLIVNQGAAVQVTLSNTLSEPVSIVFPGQMGVSASGGTPGLLTNEIAAGAGTVVYTFTASNPGTYMYQSGSHPELQIEMGLVGALIVCPTGTTATTSGCDAVAPTAYGTAATAYDREYLFLQTEMDPAIHDAVELGQPVDQSDYLARLWFINGRNGPDTMHPDNVGWLPLQPYGALARAKPGERILMRIVGAGRDLHPFHHHGNNSWTIAQDGRVLQSGPAGADPYPDFEGRAAFVGPGGNVIPALAPIPELAARGATLPDQAVSNYTILTAPGSTYDAIWTWTGLGMNWDIYGNRPGHSFADCDDLGAGYVPIPTEDPNSHCKDLQGASGKLVLPEQQALTFGGLWSGSPYLGADSALPPDQGGLNPNFGFSFMWHSHTERELTNDDIFPGGMMTMMIVEAPDVEF
ncbi:MAG: multicopper oxidase domain-containing protein [Gammaproteobacteria bacterium]|nr:multicopper oxidase domain-containing protein [Gammaproteobacteria bacterium]